MTDDRISPTRGETPFSAGGRHAASVGTASGHHEDSGDGIDRALTLANVARDARLERKYMLLVVLASAIATLGLLQGSTAVVIGAMLVSPLLGPIMGIGFGLATFEPALIKRALVTLGAGIGLAIAVAMVIVWLSPISDVTPELRARTQPTLLDLGVAVVGGIAGVYSIMRRLSGVMVGVAIATALVPPLSTVGFGLVTGRPEFALGAGLLFLTNALAIAFSATLVARLNHFGPSLTPQHTAVQLVGILSVIGVLAIPLGLSLNTIAAEVRARSVVQNQLQLVLGDEARIDTLAVRQEADGIVVDGVVIVGRYTAGLPRKIEAELQRLLGQRATVRVVQLRQQTDAGVQLEAQLQSRIAALEDRSAAVATITDELMVGGLIRRDQLLIDGQAQRIIVVRDRDAEGEQVASAIDRIVASIQSRHSDWRIESGGTDASSPADPANGTADR